MVRQRHVKNKSEYDEQTRNARHPGRRRSNQEQYVRIRLFHLLQLWAGCHLTLSQGINQLPIIMSRHYKDHTYSKCRSLATSRASSQDEKIYPGNAVHGNDSQSSSSENDSKGESYKRKKNTTRHSRRHATDRSRYPSSGDESSSTEHNRRRQQSRQLCRSWPYRGWLWQSWLLVFMIPPRTMMIQWE